MIFSFLKKNGSWGILGPPSYGIGATIRIGREMLCLPYAGFLYNTRHIQYIFFSKVGADPSKLFQVLELTQSL